MARHSVCIIWFPIGFRKAINIHLSKLYRASDDLLISSEGFRGRLVELGVDDKSIHYFPQWVEDVMENSNLLSSHEYKEVMRY